MQEKKWDVFVSYSSGDRTSVAIPLAKTLRKAGVKVWIDEQELKVGDSLSERIDEGLSDSLFGVAIVSPDFFEKHWTKRELAGLRAREEEGQKVILPVWHKVNKAKVRQYSPILSDIVGVSTENGIEHVAHSILDAIFSQSKNSLSARRRILLSRKLVKILESEPKKETLVDFISVNEPLINYYPLFGSNQVTYNVSVGDLRFDLMAYSIGHAISFHFVEFTELWNDPFLTPVANKPIISQIMMDAIYKAKFARHWLSINEDNIIDSFIERLFGEKLQNYPYIRSKEPKYPLNCTFRIYGGRRRYIDYSQVSHDTWSYLLHENNDLSIKTYDSIVDFFVAHDTNKS